MEGVSVWDMLAHVKQAAREGSFEDGVLNSIPRVMVSNPIEAGNVTALQIAHDAVEITSRRIAEAMASVALLLVSQQVFDQLTKSLSLLAELCALESEPLAVCVRSGLSQAADCKSVGDFYQLEQYELKEANRDFMAGLNACLVVVYSGIHQLPLDVHWDSNPTAQASERLARAIRQHLYPFVSLLLRWKCFY